MRRDDWIRLKHMLDAAKEVLSFLKGKSRSSLETDRQLILAIVREVEIIGEAAGKVSDETRNRYPEVPWFDIINMRNHLIHVYYDIDLDIVWDTATKDLPNLIESLEKITADTRHD